MLQLTVVGAALLLATAAQAATVSAKGPSLCAASEQAVWNCTTKTGKLASLCASKPLSATQGYVQYHYGTSAKTEMLFPATTQATQQQFRYGRYTRPLVTMLGVWFSNAGYDYELRYDMHDDQKFTSQIEEIVITAPDKKETRIACKKTSGSLSALEDIVSDEKDLVP